MPNEEKPIETKLRATFGSKITPDEFDKLEAAWTVAKRANMSETNKPVRWSTPEGRANMLLAQLTDSVLVWAIRQPQEVQAHDKALLAALKEKYAKVKSQEAYQQDWRDISQQPGEKFDDYFQRLEIAYDNAYRDPEFREPKVKSRLLVGKFRDSIRDTRTRESILDKGILDDERKLKDSLVIIGMAKRATEVGDLLKSSHAVGLVNHPNHDQLRSMITEAVDKAVVAAMQRHGPQVPRQSQKGKGADRNQQKTWCCHYCNTTNHTGGWRSCPDRRKYNPTWTPRSHQKPILTGRVTEVGEKPSEQDFHKRP